ncbi:glutathione S-transferase family protein [Nitratireductor sp. XY-223]|uniref:glutathione S-transferase family protein n=1 Tax=Nitratireductor sp. XY-223 TaxID=2561926 RepID=UPI0010A9A0FD|nr:glutathione S-transferase family protein [Nitratireductor sp. XY-223]
MGMLVDGVWQDVWYDTRKSQGRFKRADSQFRNWVTADGSAGPSGREGFKAESGRYHLYISYACPWAHRTLIVRKLKGLKDHISLSIVHFFMGSGGWEFSERDGATADPINGADNMWQVYTAADPTYTGRVTVPVLWDKKQGTIVSNESSEIIRMFNSAFDGLEGVDAGLDLYPQELRADIDAINEPIYHNVNNGVYKCGFATKQEAYEEAFDALFETLDMVEERLSERRYLMGDRVTEADWRLFTTLVRFDPVYVGHFKCNKRRIQDYPALSGYLRELYQIPGIADTVNMLHIKNHYYMSHETVNPTRIVPKGPDIDLLAPHGRDAL